MPAPSAKRRNGVNLFFSDLLRYVNRIAIRGELSCTNLLDRFKVIQDYRTTV
jgi:hypothetical protein